MRNKELIKWMKLWKLKAKFSQTAYIESMELSWENLPTRHLPCLGSLKRVNSKEFSNILKFTKTPISLNK